jgi:PST family polysaccharide transporter
MLGPKWHEAARIFRWLAPTIMAFGLIHPFSWVMLATGRAGRAVRTALAITPLLILGYAIGLHWGPQGVAAGFSISMAIAVVPVILWAKHGTLISARDVFKAAICPLMSIVMGAATILLTGGLLGHIRHALPRLAVETAILFGIHLLVLLFVMNQKAVYVALLRDSRLWPFYKSPPDPAWTAS